MQSSPGIWIRPPAVAGLFYPDDPTTLRHQVHALLQDAAFLASRVAVLSVSHRGPKALIVPHAGYLYSGATAAAGFATLMNPPSGSVVQRVVLIGPSHRVHVRGLGVSSVHAFATPLGNVPVDPSGMQWLLAQTDVAVHDQAHQPEHGLEVELPFLQEVLPSFAILPVLFGHTDRLQIAGVLHHFSPDPQTLIVVSSDLSHYLPDEESRRADTATAAKIEAFQAEALHAADACGHTAIAALLMLAREAGWRCTRLDMRHSGMVPGADQSRVVGYGAWIFS